MSFLARCFLHRAPWNGNKIVMVSTRSSSSSSTSLPAAASASTSKINPHPAQANAKTKARAEPKSKAKHKATPSPKFPYDLPYPHLCLRTHPHLYRTGIGEQGVLMVEPYKSEILPHWRFKNPATASASSSKLHSIFLSYLEEDDFVGADMARKFIQMGYTRARRYANHKGGKKYSYDNPDGGGKETCKAEKGKRRELARLEVKDQDPEKVEAAGIFKTLLDDKVWTNQEYLQLREEHIEWAKGQETPTEDSEEVKKAILENPGEERVVRKW